MTGKFIITRQHLAELGACEEGMAFYDQTSPTGHAEYQDMLDQAVKANHTNYAIWLLNKVGPTNDILEVDSLDDADLDIVFAGHIKIRLGARIRRLICGDGITAGDGIEAGDGITAGRGIEAGGGIEAGRGIEAGGGIEAGRGIEAGWCIEAGDGIEAGWCIEAGRGIEAGWGIKAGWGIEAGDGIEAGWGIKASRGIEAGWGIKAGRGIEAGDGIKAGCGIEAGDGIKAGCGIEAGGYGIYAGLHIKPAEWSMYAVVTAKTKPENLVSGFWRGQGDD